VDGSPVWVVNSDARRVRFCPAVAMFIGLPLESYWICVGTPPQQQHDVGCVLVVVVITVGGCVGGVLTTVTGTTCTEQFAVLLRPCPSVAVTVANFVPVVPNVTLLLWVNPVTSPVHWNVTGATPPAYPATNVTVFPMVIVGLLTEHATLKVPVIGGCVLSTNTVTESVADFPSFVQVTVYVVSNDGDTSSEPDFDLLPDHPFDALQ